MPPLLRAPADTQRREWWWLAWVALLAGALLVTGLWFERQRVEARERALLAQQAGVLHDNVQVQLEAINSVLSGLQTELRGGLGTAGGRARVAERMRNFADAMPAVRNFLQLDADGRVLASSTPGLLGRDLNQRDYFQAALHTGQADTLVVSRPFFGALGDWVLVLGRAVRTANGAFGGVVAATLDVQHFHALLQSVRYAPDMRVSMSHGDGLRFMALGADSEPEGLNLAQPGTLFTRHRDGGQAASVQLGQPQPGYAPYLMAMRTVQPHTLRMDKPLVLAAGRPVSDVFADWRAQAWRLGVFYLLACAVACMALRLMHRRQNELNAQTRLLQAEQQRQQEMLRRLAENLPGMLYQYQMEPDGRKHFPYASPRVADVFGLTAEQLRVDAAAVFARIHPDDLPHVRADIRDSAGGLTDWKSECRVVLPGVGERWLSGQARPQRLDSGAVLWYGYIHDVTDVKRQALQLQETERLLQQIMSDMPVGLCMVDAQRRIYFRNRHFLEHLGYTEAEVPTLHEWALRAYPERDYRQLAARSWSQALASAPAQGGVIAAEPYRVMGGDGVRRVMEIGGLVFGEHFLVTFQDRTEQQAQSDRLRALAYMDGLTGIANRRQFDQQLDAEWRSCRRHGSSLAVLMLDVDYFKQYNDLHGHQQGDECLKAVATALRGQLRRSHDLVARYGGEEFVCLLPDCDLPGATEKAQAMCRAVQALGMAHGGSAVAGVVTISLGVACQVPDAQSTPQALLMRADAHLYRAKKQGRNRVEGGV